MIKLWWVGCDWLAAHARGRGRYGPIPVRDIIGMPPGAQEQVDKIVTSAADAQVAQAMRGRGLLGRIAGMFWR